MNPRFIQLIALNASISIVLLWIINAILFCIILVILIYYYYLRSYLSNQESLKSKLEEKYVSYLMGYLKDIKKGNLISPDQKIIIAELKKVLVSVFKRRLLVATFLKLKTSVSGEIVLSINRLYKEIGLHTCAIKDLQNKHWEIVAMGIQELSTFAIKDAGPAIKPLLEHPRNEVRREAQMYMVSIFHIKGLRFLNSYKESISEWDQIQLLELLQQFDIRDFSSVKFWIKSSNDSIVLFALKFIKIYQLLEEKTALILLLNHPNKKIRIEVISILSYFNVSEVKNSLKNNFEIKSLEEQIAIFNYFEVNYTINDSAFIQKHIHDKSFEIKELSLRILKNNNSTLFKSKKNSTTNPEFIKIFDYTEKN